MTFSKIKISSNKAGQNQFAVQILGWGFLLCFILVVNLLTFYNKHSEVLSPSEMPLIETINDQVENNTKSLVDFAPVLTKFTNINAELD